MCAPRQRCVAHILAAINNIAFEHTCMGRLCLAFAAGVYMHTTACMYATVTKLAHFDNAIQQTWFSICLSIVEHGSLISIYLHTRSFFYFTVFVLRFFLSNHFSYTAVPVGSPSTEEKIKKERRNERNREKEKMHT